MNFFDRQNGGTYNGRNEARKMFESPCWKKAEAKLWMKAEMKFISWKMAEINQGSNVHAVWFIRVGLKSFWVQFSFSGTLSQGLMLCSNSDVIH